MRLTAGTRGPHSGGMTSGKFNSNTVTHHAPVTVTGLYAGRRFNFLLILHSHLASPDCELNVFSTPAFALSLHGSAKLATTRENIHRCVPTSSLWQWRAGAPSSLTTKTSLLPLLQHLHPSCWLHKVDPSQLCSLSHLISPWSSFLPPP